MDLLIIDAADREAIIQATGTANKLQSAIDKYGTSSPAKNWLDQVMLDIVKKRPVFANGQIRFEPIRGAAPQQAAGVIVPDEKDIYVPDEGAPQKAYGKSAHVYGANMAACLSAGMAKNGEDKTLFLEGARGQNKQFDWSRNKKISICTSILEHPVMYGVLIGQIPECTFSNHGQTNKSFDLKNQGGNFYVSLREKDKQAIGVRVSLADGLYWASMLYDAISYNTSGISRADLRDYIRDVIAPGMAAAQQQRRGAA